MANTKRRRAYIGNLRPRPNLTHNLYNNLFLPHGLHVKNYPSNKNDGKGDNGSGDDAGCGIVVAAPKMSNNRHHYAETKASSHYALVEFDDVDYAIRILNGVVFDGRTLRLSKEKTNFVSGGGRNGMGGGFGSSSWAGGDGSGGGGGGGGFRSSKGRQSKYKESRTGGQGNNTSSNDVKKNVASNENNRGKNAPQNHSGDGVYNGDEAITKEVESIISSEIKESSDEVTAAIACTAAMTLLSSMDAFGLGEEDESNLASGSNLNELNDKQSVPDNNMTNEDFRSRCKVPLTELFAEYGERDVDWKSRQQSKQQPQDTAKNEDVTNKDDFRSRCQMPLTDLMAEYGEQDADWKKDQHPSTSTPVKNKHQNTNNPKPQSAPREYEKNNNNDNNGMLAHFNNASIHLELVSFGYKYGAPSHSKRGFTYAHPLPPLDVRDLDRCPGHVAKFTGLSHLVKRALLNPSTKRSNDDDDDGNGKEDEGNVAPKVQSPMRRRANEMADEIIAVLVESIDEGGHGAISPLTMTVSVGSEYGRHRSVVLVEHLGVVLRARLRRNDGRCFDDDDAGAAAAAGENDDVGRTRRGKNNGIVRQPVSVGTRHRDVDARHRDEEAFGEDLKREARKAEKQAKRRQMEDGDDGGWGDSGW